MPRRAALVALLLAGLLVASAPAASAGTGTNQEGIAFTAWWHTLYDGTEPEEAMANLADTGANSVSILATWYQRRVTSTAINRTRATPTDAGVVHMIREAHAQGLDVLLKPHVDLWNDPAHWRGEIGQTWTPRSPRWIDWFRSYRAFIFHYAELAQREGVERFSVGCELSGTVGRGQQWRRVIAGVRARFDGEITYASTEGGEEHRIRWWDAVDVMGIDAYYELTESASPTLQQLKDGWAPYVEDLAALSKRWGDMPIVFTEIGYRSIDGSNTDPWNFERNAPVDLQEQADCYRAAFEVVWDEPWFAGMYWWDWSADPAIGGPTDDTYTAFGKPAEDVLRTWY